MNLLNRFGLDRTFTFAKRPKFSAVEGYSDIKNIIESIRDGRELQPSVSWFTSKFKDIIFDGNAGY